MYKQINYISKDMVKNCFDIIGAIKIGSNETYYWVNGT